MSLLLIVDINFSSNEWKSHIYRDYKYFPPISTKQKKGLFQSFCYLNLIFNPIKLRLHKVFTQSHSPAEISLTPNCPHCKKKSVKFKMLMNIYLWGRWSKSKIFLNINDILLSLHPILYYSS